MDILVTELKDKTKNYYEITNDIKCLETLKIINNRVDLKIGYDTLNLGKKLYGKNKKESVKIQKQNCKYILKLYKIIKKAVKILRKKKLFFDEIFVVDLSKKLNNNDFMIQGLLTVDFNRKTYKEKLQTAYEFSSDFLDRENGLNNMCDFRLNQCRKFRDKKVEKITGCCPTYCKLLVPGQACVHKNLSCKIYMCDSVISKGYYFTPYTLAVMKKNFSPMQILVLSGSFFRTPEKALKRLWLVNLFRALCVLGLLAVVALFTGKFLF